MRHVLMVAFQFPPMSGSSSVHRTLRFARDLPAFGWQPIVLTAQPRAYDAVSDDLLDEVPPGTIVERAFALDTRRHLSLFGRYPAFLARPDRWLTWRWGAATAGKRLVERWKPAALWSTYPIPSAHLVGAALARHCGLPWIAEFRDPMAHQGYPADPRTWESFLRVEQRTFPLASASVFVAEGAARLYRQRYPEHADRMHVIENGFDDESFSVAQRSEGLHEPLRAGALTILHSGVVYPEWRNPEALFQAVSRLRAHGDRRFSALRLRFRASGNDAFIGALAEHFGLTGQVELLPAIAHREALVEMMRADALLVLQSSGCNDQVPAKLYEYFRAGRPVLALTDPTGDTAATMRQFGVDAVVPLDSADEIGRSLPAFLDAVSSGTAARGNPGRIAQASRRAKAGELATLLDKIASPQQESLH